MVVSELRELLMRFFDRTEEIASLREIRELSESSAHDRTSSFIEVKRKAENFDAGGLVL
jgi:hypothetical protein